VAAGNIGNNASLRNKNTHAKRVKQLIIVVSVLSGQLALEHKQQTFNVHYVQILSHVTADSIGYLAMDRARLLQHAQVAHPRQLHQKGPPASHNVHVSQITFYIMELAQDVAQIHTPRAQ